MIHRSGNDFGFTMSKTHAVSGVTRSPCQKIPLTLKVPVALLVYEAWPAKGRQTVLSPACSGGVFFFFVKGKEITLPPDPHAWGRWGTRIPQWGSC